MFPCMLGPKPKLQVLVYDVPESDARSVHVNMRRVRTGVKKEEGKKKKGWSKDVVNECLEFGY